jgi:hypothetical protein
MSRTCTNTIVARRWAQIFGLVIKGRFYGSESYAYCVLEEVSC